MIRAIEDGMYQPSMKERMAELEAEKAMLQERLAAAPDPPKVRLHPNLAGLYREEVAALEQALTDPAIKAEAAEIMRSHIQRISLAPNDQGTLDNHLYGNLARILELREAVRARRAWFQTRTPPAVGGRGVNCRWLRGQDLDFVHFS
ncbi:MAG TPA: DNA resolvase [Patescibacteria group bacterium]|nr:DNA resolvase [Patescibacteria group bacterium]